MLALCAVLRASRFGMALEGARQNPGRMASVGIKPYGVQLTAFVISGAIMSEGDIAKRLIAFARACFSWLSGGLAVSTVASAFEAQALGLASSVPGIASR